MGIQQYLYSRAWLVAVFFIIGTTQSMGWSAVEDMQPPVEVMVSSTDTTVDGQSSGATGLSTHPFFSIEQVDGTAARFVDEVKFQIAIDPTFVDVVWGSGWQSTTPIESGERSDDIEQAGAALSGLVTYFVRARFRNAVTTGPWSVQPYEFTTGPAILPASGHLIDGQPTGAVGVSTKPILSAVYNHQDPSHVAHQMKVRIFLTSDGSQVWGSGWQDIADLLPGERGPDVMKGGTPLQGLADYQVSIQFMQGTPSEPEIPPVDFSTGPAILAATDYLIDGQPAGATNVTLKPAFSAIYNHQDPSHVVSEMRVKIFLTSTGEKVWGSGWQNIADLLPGQRSPNLVKTGASLDGLTDYGVGIQFRNDTPSEPEIPPVDFSTGASILPATDYLIDGQSGGASNVSLNPTFSAIYNHQDPSHPANNMKVKIYLTSTGDNVWGSGWVAIADLFPGQRSIDLVKTGALLEGLTAYGVSIQFMQGTPSEPEIPPVDFNTGPSILPASDYLIDGQAGGATNVSLKPAFSAVYNHQDPAHVAHQMKVKIYRTSDGLKVWGSGWKDIADLFPGQRSVDVEKTGLPLEGLTAYGVSIQFRQGTPSEPEIPPVDFATQPGPVVPGEVFVDSIDAQIGQDAQSIPVVDSTPVFSMVVGHQVPTIYLTDVRIQVSMTPDFDDVVWNSGWEAIYAASGDRTSDIAYDGPMLFAGVQYFIRVRSRDENGDTTIWSDVIYSFVVQGVGN